VISYVFFVSGRKSHSRLLLFLLLNNSSLGVVLFFSPSTHNNQTGKMYRKPNAEVDCRDSVFYRSTIYMPLLLRGNILRGSSEGHVPAMHLCFRRTGPLDFFPWQT
jgi:hypothetical protein